MRARIHGPWPREVRLKGPLHVRDLLVALRLSVNAATVTRKDQVLPLEATVDDDDTVDIVCVVEGGSATGQRPSEQFV